MWELVLNIIDSVLLILFINKFNTCRYEGGKKYALSLMAFLFLLANIEISDHIVLFSIVTVFVDFAIVVIYGKLAISEKINEVIAAFVFFYMGIFASSYLNLFIIKYLFNIPVDEYIVLENPIRIIGVAVKFVLILYLYFLIRLKCCLLNANSVFFKSLQWLSIIVLGLLISITEIILMVSNQPEIIGYVIMIGLGIWLLGIFSMMYCFKYWRDNQQKEMIVTIFGEQIKNYEKDIRHYEELRVINHDLKQCFSALDFYMLKGNYDKAQRYISTLLRKVNMKSSNMPYGNSPWENLINIKENEMSESNIMFDVQIDVCQAVEIDMLDFCTILGNLIDNAMEAAKKEEHRYIQVKLKTQQQFIFVCVKNIINESVLKKNPMLRTWKPNRTKHGLGISSIKSIVKRYHGKLELKEENSFFVVNVMMMNREK